MKFFASFPRKIVQEYGNVDIGLDIDPRDQRTNIIDPRDQEDPEKHRLRILNVVLTFQIRVGRINQHDKDLDWKSLTNLMYTEPEHKVKKNLNFPEDVKLNYWTREGRITKMIIRKPDKPEHFDNLHYSYRCETALESRPWSTILLRCSIACYSEFLRDSAAQ